MKKNFLFLIIIPLIGVILFLSFNLYQEQKQTTPSTQLPSQVNTTKPLSEFFPLKIALADYKRLVSSHNVSYEPININPQIPSYSLPLKLDLIDNFQRFSKKLNLPQSVINSLLKEGFTIFDPAIINPSLKFDEFNSFYDYFRDACSDFECEEKKLGPSIPFFITTDTLLHYYHLIFSSTLLRIERDLFFDNLWNFNLKMLEKSVEDYNKTNDDLIKEASRRNIAYFLITLKLLQPKENQVTTARKLKEKNDPLYEQIVYFCGNNASCIRKFIENNIPNEFSKNDLEKYKINMPSSIIKEVPEVVEELKLIEEAKDFTYSPLFIYKEDYSQYVPRGHYTKGEKLKNYFKAMMWLGRMTMLAKGSESLKDRNSACLKDGIISVENAKIQTTQALLISKYFKENEYLQNIWKKIYAITSFFVGFSDDLGPYEYVSALDKVLQGQELTSQKIDDLQKFIINDLPYPKIYSGLGNCVLPGGNTRERSETATQFLKNTKGFRLMGQRYVIDSYLMSNLVSPYTGYYTGDTNNLPFSTVRTEAGTLVRGFPRGLDIMALLGSERAKYWIQKLKDDQYTDYYPIFNTLYNEIYSLSLEEWLNNLYTSWLFTLKPLLEKFGPGYQTFMQQESYQDKLLTTALASWTQLRHDTILYVKQSYTMSEGGIDPGYIKSRSYVEPIPEFYNRLLFLSKVTENGLKELLTPQEYEKIFSSNSSLKYFIEMLEKILNISIKEIQNKELTEEEYNFLDSFNKSLMNLTLSLLKRKEGGEALTEGDFLKTTLVADVHTDGNSGSVLEEGVGYLKAIVVAYKLPNGKINIGLGPVFSYYEFKHPNLKRLTDEEWKQIISENPPTEPEWVLNYLSK